MKKGIIIAGFAGVGKTVLANKYNNIIDLEIMNFKWNYEKEINDVEKRKGTTRKTRKVEWPENYIQAIVAATNTYDIVLISTDNEILEALDRKGMEYILCFPDIECKKEYLDRYRNRGNIEEFISKVGETFEELIESLKSSEKSKIILKSNETLEVKLQKILKKKGKRQNHTIDIER